MKKLSSKSNFWLLFANGEIEHIINPWRLELNIQDQQITISKRNWYYFGINSETISFRFIRKIAINEHLFGGNIWIKVVGGAVTAKYLPKKDLKVIRTQLLDYNQTKGGKIIFA